MAKRVVLIAACGLLGACFNPQSAEDGSIDKDTLEIRDGPTKDRPDAGKPDSIQADGSSDSTPDTIVPDTNVKLVQGAVSTMGPAGTSTAPFKLVEGGFESEERVCGTAYCVTGGVTP